MGAKPAPRKQGPVDGRRAAKPEAVQHPSKSAQPLQDPYVAKIKELQELDMKVEEQKMLA